MIPRPGVLQGAECGLAFALLYGLGTGASVLWSWLQLPTAGTSYRRTFGWISILLCVALVGYGLVRETDWQNAIRRAMGMPAVTAGLPVLIAVLSAPVALARARIAALCVKKGWARQKSPEPWAANANAGTCARRSRLQG